MLTLHSAMETKHSSSSSSHYYCAEQLLTFIIGLSCLLLEAFLITTIHVAADSTGENYYFPSSNVNGNLSSYYENPEYSLHPYSNFQLCNNESLLQALNSEKRLYGRSLDINSDHRTEYPYILYFQLFFIIPADELCAKNNASTPSYYLSLVAFKGYGKGQDPNKGQVVWTANVDSPVGESACLELNAGDTNLKLVDYDRNGPDRVVWQTNTSTPANASLTITYEGNLVLFTNTAGPNDSMLSENILWQSYEHPTDTLMVLQALRPGYNLTASESDSNKTANYTLAIGPSGTVALYVKMGYKSLYNHTSNNSTVNYTSYEYPYWVWNLSDTSIQDTVVLCWYPNKNSILQLDILPSANGSLVSYYNQLSPKDCGLLPQESKAFVFEDEGSEDKANSLNITYATFLRLESDGDLHAYTLNDTRYPNSTAIWRNFSSLFDGRRRSSMNPCRLPLFCGFYGVCQEEFQNCSSDCGGSHIFVLQDPTNPKSGCKLKDDSKLMEPNSTTLSDATLCHSKNFSVIYGARYFSNAFRLPDQGSISPENCRESCKNNCSCTAAFWQSSSGGSCFLIQGPVATIIVVNASASEEFQGFLKLIDNSTPSSPPSLFIRIGAAVLGIITVMAILVAGYLYRRRRLQAKKLEDHNDMEAALLGASLQGSKPRRFTWKEMHENTCGFSDPLGSGGFGKVFRGAMADGTPIAVKQLIDGGQQGNKEFIAEVSILGRTHHLHLVRLIGFCLEGTMHKLLVYEYMENGSLDAWIFSKTHKDKSETDESKEENMPRPALSWERRFDIALGTAKGLAYLHEECEDRVIHMDLKPQNILLGADFFPKISDFGMSRRVVRGEESAVVTMMRGTPGYLAPEWLTDGAVTEKCDVYSYGILLLEIVSGRRVRDWRALRRKLDMSRNLHEGVMELVDERLTRYGVGVGVGKKKIYDEKQAMRMVEIAMMCLLSDPGSRPSMSRVVHMLEGKVEAIALHEAPNSEDYQAMGLLIPSKKMKDGVELEQEQEQEQEQERYKHHFSEMQQWPDESWGSGSGSGTTSSTTMGRTRKSLFSGKTSYKYMEISKSEEYMDSLDPGHTYKMRKQ